MTRNRTRSLDSVPAIAVVLAVLAAIAVLLTLMSAPPASAASGGTTIGGGGTRDGTGGGSRIEDATLLPSGRAVPPEGAPKRVRRAIRFANRIRDTRYEWGGGHGSFEDDGYDCSGAVSYALHGGRLLDSPLDSSGLMRWGERGRGRWITVYANRGHTYAVIAGLRWDTSGGPGPRWHADPRSAGGYAVRHPAGP